MQQSTRLSKLMRLSWEIQKRKPFGLRQKQKRSKIQRSIRSLALETAWAIVLNEDITVYHLVKRYSHDKYPNKIAPDSLALFQNP